jgi:hypothetical protein
MARAKSNGNGHLGRLEEAMATLLQDQATFVQSQPVFQTRTAKLERITAERFAPVHALLLEHSRIPAEHTGMLADHGRILQGLSEAIREKIGFKAPEPR